jgi:hypothetical protein
VILIVAELKFILALSIVRLLLTIFTDLPPTTKYVVNPLPELGPFKSRTGGAGTGVLVGGTAAVGVGVLASVGVSSVIGVIGLPVLAAVAIGVFVFVGVAVSVFVGGTSVSVFVGGTGVFVAAGSSCRFVELLPPTRKLSERATIFSSAPQGRISMAPKRNGTVVR